MRWFNTRLAAAVMAVALVGVARADELPGDAALPDEMRKLIGWLDKGTAEQQGLARDALRMAPAEALPVMREMLEGKTLTAEGAARLTKIYETQKASRDFIAESGKAAAAWEARAIAAYDKVGQKNPAWDAQARTLLNFYISQKGTPMDAMLAANAVKTSKCDDPFVMFWVAWSTGKGSTPVRRWELLKGVFDSKWPGSAKLVAAQWTLRRFKENLGEEDKVALRAAVKASVDRVAEMLEDGPSGKRVRDLVINLVATTMSVEGKGTWESFESIRPGLQGPIEKWRPAAWLVIEGAMHTDEYTELRGYTAVNDVPAKNWEGIHRHVDGALTSFRDALKLDPSHDVAALGVLQALQHVQGGSLESSEAAFWEAIRTNPNATPAVETLAAASMGRWYGKGQFEAKLMRLAKVCALSRNFLPGIPQRVGMILKYVQSDLPAERKLAFQNNEENRLLVRHVFDAATVVAPFEQTLGQAMNAHLACGDFLRARKYLEKLDAKAEPAGMRVWGPRDWPKVRDEMIRKTDESGWPREGDPKNRPGWMP